MIHLPSAVRRNSEGELRAFETTCKRLGGFDPALSFEWVDGFLCALAAGASRPPTTTWLPLLCGDAFERAFADPEDAAQAQRALELRLKVLCAQLDPQELMDDPSALRLEPLIGEWTEAERQRLVEEEGVTADEVQALQTGAVWAEGFFGALEELPEVWPVIDDADAAAARNELLEHVEVLMMAPNDAALAEHQQRFYPDAPASRDELITEACYALQELRLLWVDLAPRPAQRIVAPQPGRNDPCPCGSGRKFKKCCGSGA